MNMRIYTDGACSGNPGPGGWGACYIIDGQMSHTKSGNDPNTTNNRMELTAVVEALGDPSLKGNLKRIDIYTDSAYVVNCVKNGYLARWAKNGWKNRHDGLIKHKDLWVELLTHLDKKGRKVHINKVKGHSNDKYNDAADLLATIEVNKAKCGDLCYARQMQEVS